MALESAGEADVHGDVVLSVVPPRVRAKRGPMTGSGGDHNHGCGVWVPAPAALGRNDRIEHAHKHRGEIEAEIGGTKRKLVLTLGALAEVESEFGADDLVALTDVSATAG